MYSSELMGLKTTLNVNSVLTAFVSLLMGFLIWISHEWIVGVRTDMRDLSLVSQDRTNRLTKLETESKDRWENIQLWLASIDKKLDSLGKDKRDKREH